MTSDGARTLWLDGAQDRKAGARGMVPRLHGGKVGQFREFTDTASFAEAYRG
jgi:hypothetical protein